MAHTPAQKSATQNVGVDISKETFDAHAYPNGFARQFSNDMKGFKAFLKWLADYEVVRVVFEPTGAYHHGFERYLSQAGTPLVKINPCQARRFAQSLGVRAKTDAVDAAMLARMGALFEPTVRPVVSQTIDEMKELSIARRALMKDKVAAMNRAHIRKSPLLKRQASQRLKHIEEQIAAIDGAMLNLIAEDEATKGRFGILLSIPGVGPAAALAMLIEMPELGTINHQCVSSLAGLAPIARDSGKHSGKRFIQGGRNHLRQALFMPALVAIPYNPDFKQKYQEMIGAGKMKMVAIVTIMRKLLILANALLHAERVWAPKTA